MSVPTYATKLPVYAGDSWAQTFTFKVLADPDDPDSLIAEALTDWQDWECEWRASDTSSAAITLTVDTADKDTGSITVSASPTQTRDMGRDGVFDIQAVNDTTVRTFMRAATKWRRDVTQ